MNGEGEKVDSAVKRFLQGTWLGHPLHPALVHVPTGLWPAALVFDLVGFFRPGNSAVVQTSFWCLATGMVVALLAAPTGLADWAEIKKEKPARRIGIYHMSLNGVVVLLVLINLALRLPGIQVAERVTLAQLLLSGAANAILGVSGYLGGRMVYDYGIGVARQSKQKWRKLALEGGANVPEE